MLTQLCRVDMMNNNKTLYAFLLLGLSLVLICCRKEKFTTDSSAKLEFSRDTIFFDTVFSTIGSTTQYLKVYNRHNESIRISEISLENGTNSQYRINVDGTDGPLQTDVEILPNDSIFVFVEVTVDPGNQNIPFIVEDLLHFTTNGNEQQVVLQSWGQDAYFHGGLNTCGDPISEVISNENGNNFWAADKPHVVYGIVAVDSAETLTIEAGSQVYCHGKSGIYVYKGSINILGQQGNEVVFQGDRLEPAYADIPGQWGIQLDCPIDDGVGQNIASIVRGGIWIYESPGSIIQHAVIKNGNMGIQVDTTGVAYTSTNFSVKIENTKILNMAGFGLWGQNGSIKGTNLLVGNCGQACAYLGFGGKYHMDNCTFANYWSDNSRTFPAFVLNNYYKDQEENIYSRPLVNCQFNNCIMYGNNAQLDDFNEFLIDTDDSSPAEYVFRYCLVDTDQSVEEGVSFVSMVNGIGPALCDPANFNFQVSANPSSMIGSVANANPFNEDIDGNPWNSLWMKGCYSYDPSDTTHCD